MLPKLTNLFSNEKINFLLIAWSLLFVVLAVLYYLTNGLQVYDASGHVNAIWYLKNYLWPHFSGWNPFTLVGLDQGLSYPMLFHYLAATLGFILGINLSTFLLVALSLITLPLSVYYFSGSLLEEREEKWFLTTILLLAILVLPGYFGADLKALTQVGLLPSFVSLPLVFFYLGSFKQVEKRRIFWPTILLVAIILTHLVAGLFAVGVLLLFILTSLLTGKLSKFLLLHAFSGLIITAFFWLPFLLNYSSLSTSGHLNSLGIPNLVVLMVSLIILLKTWKKKEIFLTKVSLISLVLASFTLGDYLVETFLKQGFLWEKVYNFHFYRFQVYEYLLFLAVLTSVVLPVFLKKINKRVLIYLVFGGFLFALIFLFFKTPFLKTDRIALTPSYASGRFLETFSRTQVVPLTYTIQTQLVQEKNLPWAYGLFTDATQNGPYLGSLIKSLNPDNYKKTSSNLVEDQVITNAKLAQALDLFGVSNLLQLGTNTTSGSSSLIQVVGSNKSFDLSASPATSFVEVVPWKVVPVKGNWEKEVEAWWEKSGEFNSMLINSSGPEIDRPQKGSVSVLKHDRTWSNFTVQINSSTKVPVLVKFGYSPNWKATKDGKNVPIYRSSPDLMLVDATGEVSFRYQEPLWPLALLVVSLCTIIYLWRYQKKLVKSSK